MCLERVLVHLLYPDLSLLNHRTVPRLAYRDRPIDFATPPPKTKRGWSGFPPQLRKLRQGFLSFVTIDKSLPLACSAVRDKLAGNVTWRKISCRGTRGFAGRIFSMTSGPG